MKCLTIDVGGTYIKYGLVENGIISCKGKKPTPAVPLKWGEDVDEELAILFRKKYREYFDTLREIFLELGDGIDGIAMSVAGILDSRTGYVYSGGALCYISEINFADEVSRLCNGVPVTIENDAKAAAMAELSSGVLKGIKDASVVLFGTAIGGCTICNGEIIRGSNQFSGEFSSIKLRSSSGTKETWGNLGVHTMYDEYAAQKGIEKGAVTGEMLFEKAEAGDKKACEIVRNYCRLMCEPICNLQVVTDPQVIAIGGGISSQRLFIDMLREEVERSCKEIKSPNYPTPTLVACKYRNDANLIGAYLHFINIMQAEENERTM